MRVRAWLLAIPALAGCNAILGIHDKSVAGDAGSNDASEAEGTDSGVDGGEQDSTTVGDGGGPEDSSSSDSGGGSSSDAGGEGGDGGGTSTGACPVQPSFLFGVHVNFNVTWPASTVNGQGNGAVDLWLLNRATSMGTGDLAFSATTQWCGMNLPVINLNAVGQTAVCASGMTCATKVQIAFNDGDWDGKITRTFTTTGSQTAWNTSDTLSTGESLSLFGLTAASYGGTPPAAWPAACSSSCTPDGAFAASALTDDDGDGFPGITANPLSSSSYSLPPTTPTQAATPPLADQVYFVLRNQVQLTGVQMSSCTQGSGTAQITLFDNHVVGCHIASPAGACTSAAVSFLDQNRAVYGPDATHVASVLTPITGTATIQQMASTATCADVRGIQ